MAQKYIEGIENHNKLSRFTYAKYEKRAPLRQLQKQYNVQPPVPLLSVHLPERMDIVERRRVINPSPKGKGELTEYDMSFYRPAYPRNRSAPVWVKVPSHSEMPECHAHSKSSPTNGVVPSSKIRSISGYKNKSIGRQQRSKTKPASAPSGLLYRFKPVNRTIHLSKENIQLCTALIKEQWDSENRQYIKEGAYARGKSEAKDQEIVQWFTFEGDSPGALQAFTEENTSSPPPKFSIEANVGKSVSIKLEPGTPVRIGNNGKLLHGPKIPEVENDFYTKCDQIIEMTRTAAQKHEPLHAPLTLKDVEKEARILVARSPSDLDSDLPNLNTSEAVIYNPDPTNVRYVPQSEKSNTHKLQELLSQQLVERPKEMTKLPTYEEVLESRTPNSSHPTTARLPMPSPVSKQSLSSLPQTPNHKPEKAKHATLPRDTASPRIKTPVIPDDVRTAIEMQRQCTMPAYKPMSSTQISKRPSSKDSSSRVLTPGRPPRYLPLYRAGLRTPPSISNRGLEGERSFLKINSPMHGDLHSHEIAQVDDTNSPNVHYTEEAKLPTNSHPPVVLSKPRHAQPSITNVTLVGKPPPMELMSRQSVTVARKPISPAIINPNNPVPLEEQMNSLPLATPGPSRLAVSIPMPDMTSASSAPGNSLDDFKEYELPGCANTLESSTPLPVSDSEID